jgi:hypothetical protein
MAIIIRQDKPLESSNACKVLQLAQLRLRSRTFLKLVLLDLRTRKTPEIRRERRQ